MGIVDHRQLEYAVTRSRELLLRFRRHPLWAEMDGAEVRHSEVPYCIKEGDDPKAGVIDALYLRDGSWTVVEFKTDPVRDRNSLNELLGQEDYLVQAARYVRAVESLLGTTPAAVLCLLDYGGGVQALDPCKLQLP